MISAQRTGAYISSLRKAKDWTQLDLAQRLQVTHQAVSQWEKGATFPDVALLPQLARVLGVSVDDLLSGGAAAPRPGAGRVTSGAIVEELAHGRPSSVAALIRTDPEGVDRMLEAAPLAKPSQMDDVVNNLAGYEFTLDQILSLAPFVSQEALEAALDASHLEQVDSDLLTQLAPHLSEAALERWVQRITPGALSMDELESLAPFLSTHTLGVLVRERLSSETPLEPDQLASLAPHLGKEALSELLQRLPNSPLGAEYLSMLAPHVSSEDLEQLLRRVEDPASLGQYLEELAPFLSQESLKRLLIQEQGRLTAQTLVELAPFLDRETLDEIFRRGLKAKRRQDQ